MTTVATYDIVITANSPGELAGWVRPVSIAFEKHFPEARLTLVLTPCRYASGREAAFAQTLPNIHRVILPEEFGRWIWKRQVPPLPFSPRGVILYLGGDLYHAVQLKRKLGYPATAYIAHRLLWGKAFRKLFLPNDPKIEKLVQKKGMMERATIVGDLMVDSAEPTLTKTQVYQQLQLDPNRPIVTFFTGSRPGVHQALMPFFQEVETILQTKAPHLQCLFSSSPFISDTTFPMTTCAAHNLLPITSLLITIPGTNTAQAAALGTPMLVVLPLHRPDLVELDGLYGYLANLPVIGLPLKRLAISILRQTIAYLALPNKKAGKRLVPELIGNLTPQTVAARALELLQRPVQEIARDQQALQDLMGKKGAAQQIVLALKRLLTEKTN